jgi:hypothetical protein
MYSTWYINIALVVLLESLLLWRAFRCPLWRRHPFFYAYLIYTVLWNLLFSLPILIRSSAYSKAYWWSHVLAAILRFGIAAEVYRYTFPRNSPLRRRTGVVVFCALTLLAALFWVSGPGPGHYLLDALRKIASAVAAWILVVLGLAQYYGIRIGRNISGMAVGLLIFMGSELVHLSAMDLFPRLRVIWGYVHPITFVCMLAIWTFALWRYAPNPPSPAPDRVLAREFLSAWQDRWAQVSNILRRMVKP